MKRPMRWGVLTLALLICAVTGHHIVIFLALSLIAAGAHFSAIKRLILIARTAEQA